MRLHVHWRTVSRYERPDAWVRRVAIRLATRSARRERIRPSLERVAAGPIGRRGDRPRPGPAGRGRRAAHASAGRDRPVLPRGPAAPGARARPRLLGRSGQDPAASCAARAGRPAGGGGERCRSIDGSVRRSWPRARRRTGSSTWSATSGGPSPVPARARSAGPSRPPRSSSRSSPACSRPERSSRARATCGSRWTAARHRRWDRERRPGSARPSTARTARPSGSPTAWPPGSRAPRPTGCRGRWSSCSPATRCGSNSISRGSASSRCSDRSRSRAGDSSSTRQGETVTLDWQRLPNGDLRFTIADDTRVGLERLADEVVWTSHPWRVIDR